MYTPASMASPSTVETSSVDTTKPHTNHSVIVAGSIVGTIILSLAIVISISILVILLIRKNVHKGFNILTSPNSAYSSKLIS